MDLVIKRYRHMMESEPEGRELPAGGDSDSTSISSVSSMSSDSSSASSSDGAPVAPSRLVVVEKDHVEFKKIRKEADLVWLGHKPDPENFAHLRTTATADDTRQRRLDGKKFSYVPNIFDSYRGGHDKMLT